MEKQKEMTPFERKYLSIREKEKLTNDTILLVRVGDFYEVASADAGLVSHIWGIPLVTCYGFQMCGIECHSVNEHVKKLLDYGYKVALAEPAESSSSKGVQKYLTRTIAETNQTSQKGDD